MFAWSVRPSISSRSKSAAPSRRARSGLPGDRGEQPRLDARPLPVCRSLDHGCAAKTWATVPPLKAMVLIGSMVSSARKIRSPAPRTTRSHEREAAVGARHGLFDGIWSNRGAIAHRCGRGFGPRKRRRVGGREWCEAQAQPVAVASAMAMTPTSGSWMPVNIIRWLLSL